MSIKVFQNEIITGSIPLTFSVGVQLVYSKLRVDINSQLLSIDITDSDGRLNMNVLFCLNILSFLMTYQTVSEIINLLILK